MKLKSIVLQGFRSYRDETRIPVENLTAFIGKNDVGKSSILEALEIFFNNSLVKLEIRDLSVFSSGKQLRIGCVFDELSEKIVLDVAAETTLGGECLLNEDGALEIHKIFDCSGKTPKESVVAIAVHPTAENAEDLLQLTNTELKSRLKKFGIDEKGVDLRKNPAIRKAIWDSLSDLSLARQEIHLGKGDAKTIWDALRKELPLYALFQADRPSKDEDAEVQDPMKLAVLEAIKEVEPQLEEIKKVVTEKATEVAARTVEKLKEMDPGLAGELSPHFKTEPKWEKLFTLTLTSDDQIPINKRGSGVRRLILLNFFRASAEQQEQNMKVPGIIYAIEEPEASQHPINQKMLVEALAELSEQENRQVLITTHVPGLAGMLPTMSIRNVRKRDGKISDVVPAGDDMFEEVASELGVIPDNRVKVLVCVEGPNDISCIKHLSALLHRHRNEIPDLTSDPRVAFVSLGGSTLQQWVANRYLKGLGRREVHLYDRGAEDPPKYQMSVDALNTTEGCYAILTGKRELENYLHAEAIQEVFGVQVAFGDTDNVSEIVARTIHEQSDSTTPWNQLTAKARGEKVSDRKRRLNSEVASKMTIERLAASDPNEDLSNWLRQVAACFN